MTGDACQEREAPRKSGVRAEVQRELCTGDGLCVNAAPEVFRIGDEGFCEVIEIGEGDEEGLRKAAEECPAQAIVLLDDRGNQLYP